MISSRRHGSALCIFLLVCLALTGCGDDSPWRYAPGVPASPTALVATSGNGQVSLSWVAADGAAAYNVYYSTQPGVGKNGIPQLSNLTGNSCIVSGLANDVVYYFAVTAASSSGMSAPSNEVTVAPSAPGPFLQSDLQGTWYFNALATGPDAKWMRGSVVVDPAGNVSVAAFLDSTGQTSAPADLFGPLTILPDGMLVQTNAVGFRGVLSANQFKDLIVGTASTAADAPTIMVLQKRVPGVSYAATDIQGTGKLVAGPLAYVYHQLSGGAAGAWEYGSGQIGRDQTETYTAISGPTPRPLPGAGNKVTNLAITVDGIVSESAVPGVLPPPSLLLDHAVMSADKMTIVGTATDQNGACVLRVMQFVHPPAISLTASSYAGGDLTGTYQMHMLFSGSGSLWGNGSLTLDATGAGSYGSYLDSSGSAALPAAILLSMDQQGMLTDAANPTDNGQLAYFKDLLVATGTGTSGASFLSIGVKR